jgi:ribose/xylose/arabinose/galactoside ABC-type transport system permease subunit
MYKMQQAILIKRIVSKNVVILVSVAAFIVFSFIKPLFISATNLNGLLIEAPSYGLAAIGLTFCLLCNQLDISMGAVISLSTVLFALLSPVLGFAFALLIVFAAAILVGMINGLLVGLAKLDAFMISLSTMTAVRGVALLITDTKPVPCHDPIIVAIGNMNIGFVPVVFIFFLAMVFVAEFVLKYTMFGRNIYAVGAAPAAAAATGIKTRFTIFIVFVINAFFSALSGFVMLTRMQSGSPILASDAALSIISMVVIGGTALNGGRGGALRTLSGIIIMGLIFNIMSMMNIYVNIQNLIKGAIVLGVVVMDRYAANKNKKV